MPASSLGFCTDLMLLALGGSSIWEGWGMGIWRHCRPIGVTASVAALVLLPGCGAQPEPASETGTSAIPATTAAPVTTTTAIAAPTTRSPRTEMWIDLAVGDCVAEPPPTDPSVVTVTVVDCATAHSAEVYLLSAAAVNTAIAGVADRECAAGFFDYTGQPLGGSAFAVTYLIDSNQDRTSANPFPSTIICLLQGADGRPLSASARR